MNLLYLWHVHKKRERLSKMPLEKVKALWDQYDGTNAPNGFEGEAVHLELNLRGEGCYCAC